MPSGATASVAADDATGQDYFPARRARRPDARQCSDFVFEMG